MSTIILLLSVLLQEPASSDILPDVGTEAAVLAQNEFRNWLGTASESPEVSVQIMYEVQADLGLFDPSENMEATFAGVLSSQIEAQGKVRHRLQGVATLNEAKNLPVEATLVLDGESFWFALSANGLMDLPEGGVYITGKIADLQNLYAFARGYHKWAVEQETLHGKSPSLTLGKNLATFIQSMPEQGVALLHPTSTLFYGMAPFSCQKFERKGGVALASMALDTQPESFMVEWAAQWDDFWSGFMGSSDNQDHTSKALQGLGDHLFFTLSFDEATAVPLSLNIDFEVNAEALGQGTVDERMTLSVQVSGQFPAGEGMEASMFSAPLPGQVPTDITGLLEIALTEMRNEKAKMESEMDSSF